MLADKLAPEVFKQARVSDFERLTAVSARELAAITCAHPLKATGGYDFAVPLLAGEHVTDTLAPALCTLRRATAAKISTSWIANKTQLEKRGINPAIPYTVDENGAFTEAAPGFTGKRVINDKGEKGDANEAVIKALIDAGMLIARGRLKHQYPHSWRSKKPVIFRNTPQWFIAMDKGIDKPADTLRTAHSAPSRPPAGCRRRAKTASPA